MGSSERLLAAISALSLCLACSRGEKAVEEKAAAKKVETPPSTELKVGHKIANFSAIAHTGMGFKLDRFADAPFLLAFCSDVQAEPCRSELTQLRDNWFSARENITMAIVVSQGDAVSLREIATSERFPFLLVSDPEGALLKWVASPSFEKAAERAYLIGPELKVLTITGNQWQGAYGSPSKN